MQEEVLNSQKQKLFNWREKNIQNFGNLVKNYADNS